MATSRIIVLSTVLTFALSSARASAATCTPDSNGNSVGDGWGASWSFGPTTSRIVHAKTTIVPGRVPPMSNVGPLFLWPGMSNPTSDLIQTTMDAWNGTTNVSYCGSASDGGLPTQWCVEASVFGANGQTNGPTVAIDPDDHVTIEYTLESDNETWLQTVTSQKLGKVVSTLTSKSGEMPNGGFGFATEADSCSFTIDTQYYLCTEIDLFAADPGFGATGVGGVGAQTGNTGRGSGTGTAKNLHTPDDGKTWLVDLITLPPMNPQGTQAPAPEITCGTGGATDDGGAGGPGPSDSGSGDARSAADAGGGGGGMGSSGGSSGSTGSSTGSPTDASTGGGNGSTGGSSTGGSSGSPTGGSSASSGSVSGGMGAPGSGASSSGDGGASAGSSSSPNFAAPGAEASGCGCAFVGAPTETNAGLSTLLLGLAGTVMRRRRATPKL
jgi:hypothetical protein